MSAVAGERAASTDASERESGRRPSRRRVLAAASVAVVVVAAGLFAATQLSTGSGGPRATALAAATVSVVRTDLAETTPVNGTVGFAGPSSVVEPAGTALSAVTKDEQAVTAAQQNVAADRQTQADTTAADSQSATQAQQAVTAAQATLAADTAQLADDQASLDAARQKQASDCQGSGAAGSNSGQGGASTPCASDAAAVSNDQKTVAADQQKLTGDQATLQNVEGQLTAAQQKAAQSADQAQAKLAGDATALANTQKSLAADEAASAAYDQTSKYTTLPAVGQVITPGQALWSVDGKPVPLLAGTLTPWRAFNAGMSAGADIAVLDQALIDLGDGADLSVSDTFTTATAVAIARLQASLGLPQTGSLPLGSVVFEPTGVRVTAVHPQVGANVSGGAPVLDVTSTNPVVNVALPVSQTYLVKTGDAVSVTLPDGTTAHGTVTVVGKVATAGANSTPATVNATITLAHASAAGSLDQAPVTVNITNRTARQVLAVPTTALLALAGGGDAVEVVDADRTHRLVGVTTGIFDSQSGLVEVNGSGLSAGQKIVSAA